MLLLARSSHVECVDLGCWCLSKSNAAAVCRWLVTATSSGEANHCAPISR
ncbi:hypothetical protein BC567DRAFT_182086 [Phyllosticta citribraziliensis]